MKGSLFIFTAVFALAINTSYGKNVSHFHLYSKSNSNTYFSAEYDSVNESRYIIYRDDKPVQEIYISKDLDGSVESIHTENELRLKGNSWEIQVTLKVDEEDFVEYHIFQKLTKQETVRDCILFGNETHWYGGPEQKQQQYWPVEKLSFNKYSYVTKEAGAGAVTERYWLSSEGIYAYVSFETPLFITQVPNESLCLIAQKTLPYNLEENDFVFDYYIGLGKNPKMSHMKAIELHLGKPTEIPDERMVKYPIWSTWARYKRSVNAEIVEKYANEIIDHGFKNSQLEIDDDWEQCYGSLKVNEEKFPDMKAVVNKVKKMGYRVTIWVHPFINKNCQPWYDEAMSKGYFIVNQEGNPDTKWWTSIIHKAAHIDFTNPNASDWFISRLNELKEKYDFDGFKFDAGETSWAPKDPILLGDKQYHPNILSKKYIEAVSQFGGFTEVRTAWGTQSLPIFVRMLDKDSAWTIERNGVASLVTTLLQMNMNGYPFVLPDLIGGNGYKGKPGKELFIRWVEATVFMPSIQYSFVPWDYDDETVAFSKNLTELHESVAAPIIMKAMKKAVEDGTPVNSPIWWIAPEDKEALSIGDQFLLGEGILVAPVTEKGVKSRNIYLPKGSWHDGYDGTTYEGPQWLNNYPAPLGVIPYFVKE